MYLDLPENPLTTTKVKIRYDCCSKEHTLKWKDANANFLKNGKHVCRPCWLKSNNPAKQNSAKEKQRQTCLEKYGTTMPMNSQENIEKRKKLFENEEYIKQRNEKQKQTCIERYGVEHQMHIDQVKEKVKATNMERYGVEVPLQSPEILSKVQATNLERYGDICSLNNPEVRAKALKSLFEHYGVEYYNQLPEMKDYLRDNCREWLKESWANPWAKGINRPEEWSQKQSITMTNKILAGEFNPEDARFYVTGYFYSNKCKKPKAFFRSSLELMAHWYLHNNDKVEWYENEPFAISYNNSEGNTRRYIPDFFVKVIDAKPWLLEIKPAFRMREVATQFKVEAAEKYAVENDIDFHYIDMDFLLSNSISLAELKTKPNVELIKK